jgi:hypothetical protein
MSKHTIEGMSPEADRWSLTIPWQIGELDAIVGEHRMDAVRDGFDERFEEDSGSTHVGLIHEFDHDEL